MTGTGPLRVGLIGAGNISNQYLTNMQNYPDLEVTFVADLMPEVAKAQADKYGIAGSGGVDDILNRDDVELVVNLTIPAAHGPVASQVLASGKHVWNEKPVAAELDTAQGLIEQADRAGLLIGSAPDTFLGPALQLTKKMVDRGDIGAPLTASVVFQTGGPHTWHPSPDFLYQRGGGPLFDMAPYYLTALVQIFGPIARVAALGSSAGPTRVIGSGPRAGESIDVTVPTYVGALYQFVSGLVVTAVFSFDATLPRAGILEISGTAATVIAPDPNHFAGDLRLTTAADAQGRVFPSGDRAAGRGIGVVDMARRIRSGTNTHLASGRLGLHVLDAMFATTNSIDNGAFVDVTSRVDPVASLPDDWDPTVRTV